MHLDAGLTYGSRHSRKEITGMYTGHDCQWKEILGLISRLPNIVVIFLPLRQIQILKQTITWAGLAKTAKKKKNASLPPLLLLAPKSNP